jgi:hypothetical protein
MRSSSKRHDASQTVSRSRDFGLRTNVFPHQCASEKVGLGLSTITPLHIHILRVVAHAVTLPCVAPPRSNDKPSNDKPSHVFCVKSGLRIYCLSGGVDNTQVVGVAGGYYAYEWSHVTYRAYSCVTAYRRIWFCLATSQLPKLRKLGPIRPSYWSNLGSSLRRLDHRNLHEEGANYRHQRERDL